jgi:hypothetical protein
MTCFQSLRVFLGLVTTVMLNLLLAPDARPEVRSYTVGLDVNCPTGLGE